MSKIPIRTLRSLVHKKRQDRNVNNKPGRVKFLDLISEEKIMKECSISAPTKIASIEFRKQISESIRNESLETHKRNYGTTTTENYRTPSIRTVNRYLNKFSQNYLVKNF